MKTRILILLFAAIAALASCAPKKGCTDKFAYNYDDEADDNDGSCQYLQDMVSGNWYVEDTYVSSACSTGVRYYTSTVTPHETNVMVIHVSNFAYINPSAIVDVQLYNQDYPIMVTIADQVKVSGGIVYSLWGGGTVYNTNHMSLSYYIDASNGCDISGFMEMTR